MDKRVSTEYDILLLLAWGSLLWEGSVKSNYTVFEVTKAQRLTTPSLNLSLDDTAWIVDIQGNPMATQRQADLDPAELDDIIIRLKEVRSARPGKLVELSETQIRKLCRASRDIFLRQPNCLSSKLPSRFATISALASSCPYFSINDTGLLCDLLWSDPCRDIQGWGMNDGGVSYTFGPDKVSEFLTKHDLDLVCRANQVVEDGYEFFADKQLVTIFSAPCHRGEYDKLVVEVGYEFFAGRQLITVFSAPNYCGKFDNSGAVLLVDEDLTCSLGDFEASRVCIMPNPMRSISIGVSSFVDLVVASVGEDKKISLWRKNGQSMGTVPVAGTDTGDNIEESIMAIAFSNKGSRYMCSGGSGQVVRIWDLQRKRCIKWLRGHTSTITSALYNCKDEHLASISLSGDLILHNLASGARAAELKDPNEQVV
ncbi:hypothetical protein GH714_036352 [Hevea brasiliensis]|uniref:protein-serine/threonine phosphatase n=1 Tax=Hevea brasiliensis TaxID=3981 RepID=A0A6A6L6A6_HEVBR|nr:hypothetical protein GH714_036352 [Hevea brasiliensis]